MKPQITISNYPFSFLLTCGSYRSVDSMQWLFYPLLSFPACNVSYFVWNFVSPIIRKQCITQRSLTFKLHMFIFRSSSLYLQFFSFPFYHLSRWHCYIVRFYEPYKLTQTQLEDLPWSMVSIMEESPRRNFKTKEIETLIDPNHR